ncbi:MAG: serine hydrolase, partial [Candidatus Omnitrophica bacterium]|nr:serine hydrolase [Candidatus Omnitrophota bacterium]
MKSKIIIPVALFASFMILLAGCSRYTASEPMEVNIDAKSAIIVDIGDRAVLYEKNADIKFPPASTTKVMTAIIALENFSRESEFVVSKKAIQVEPTIAGFRPGSAYKLKDLISAILVKSANDAALVIAENVAGGEKQFVELMNKKARQIGMTNTHFESASGLPTGRKDKQYTTARDLAKMMLYATRYQIILEAMSVEEKYIFGSDQRRIRLKSHNRTLSKNANAPWGKTGYTKEARRTFVGADPSLTPKIVFAALKSEDLWNDIVILNDKGLQMYAERHRTIKERLGDGMT